MPSKLVDPKTIPTQTFDWGLIKPLVAKANTHNPAMSMLHVVLLPGKGHTRHNHPDADEILYILAGHGEQMVDDGKPFAVAAGQAVFVPTGAFHSTINTGWEPLSLLAIYGPAGAEEALRGLPDFVEVAPGKTAGLVRSPQARGCVNSVLRKVKPSVAIASCVGANGRQIAAALAIAWFSMVNDSITIGPSYPVSSRAAAIFGQGI